MLGAIVGDIVGSRFEWHNIKTKKFDLFTPKSFFTDDSVMTLAVADAILTARREKKELSQAAAASMQRLGRDFPGRGYGGMFASWLLSDNPVPYNSFGNGSAMRVSPCAFAATSLEEALQFSDDVTQVTHNHPEGLKGAAATTAAIYLAREGKLMAQIKKFINANYYPMDFTLDEIRESYTFNETCQDTVPQAIMAFLESTSFEDAIRNAISIGGDSDTLAAIAGGIAEAYYGIPDQIKIRAVSYLDSPLKKILKDFYLTFDEKQ